MAKAFPGVARRQNRAPDSTEDPEEPAAAKPRIAWTGAAFRSKDVEARDLKAPHSPAMFTVLIEISVDRKSVERRSLLTPYQRLTAAAAASPALRHCYTDARLKRASHGLL